MNRRPGQFLASHWPCAAALGLLALSVAVLLALCLRRCAGHLVYPLDDTYIHMAVGANLARHGVWGVTRFGFSSSVSSLLWPFLLALSALVAGVRDATPLLLNTLFAALLILLVWRLHRRQNHPPAVAFFSLAAILFFMPLPAMIFLGMEHVLHALLTVAFTAAAAQVLVAGRRGWREEWPLWALAPLLALVRYESAFVIAAGCFLFLCRRRWRLAFGLGLWSLAPLVAYGLLSVARGWSFFPNSVLLKSGLMGAVIDIPPLGIEYTIGYIADNAHLALPVVLTLVALAIRLRIAQDPWEFSLVFGMLYVVAFVPLYITLRPSLFGRYDAFLECYGLVAFFLNLPGALVALRQAAPAGRAAWLVPAALVLILVLASPRLWPLVRRFYGRACADFSMVVIGSGNIYEQQYQLGHFAGQYYAGERVAVNDIGAACYFGKIHCFDLVGLGGNEVVRARRQADFSSATMRRLVAAEKVRVAMCYDSWVGTEVPANWKKAGTWRITGSSVCGGDTVSFYALTPAELAPLKARLREFQPKLPARVIQDGDYLK